MKNETKRGRGFDGFSLEVLADIVEVVNNHNGDINSVNNSPLRV